MAKVKRVAVITNNFHPNIDGVSRFSTLLAKKLKEKKIDVCVVTLNNTKLPEGLNIPFLALKTKPVFFLNELGICIDGYKETKEFLDDFKPEVIHLVGQLASVYFSLLYADKKKIPTVATYQTYYSDFTKLWLSSQAREKKEYLTNLTDNRITHKLIDAFCTFLVDPPYNLSDSLVAVSDDVGEFLKNKYPSKEVITIPNFIDFDTKKIADFKKFGIENDYFLYVGRLSFEKGIHEIIKSYKIVSDKGITNKLVITGNGSARKSLEKLAKELNLDDKIIFTGFLIKEELNSIYKNCNTFITASPYDTFNISAAKSLYFSKPIIAPNKGGTRMFVKDNVNGFLIEYDKNFVENLAQRMIDVLNPRLNKKFSKSSKKLSKRYELNRVANEYISKYNEVYNAPLIKKRNRLLNMVRYKIFIFGGYYLNQLASLITKRSL